MKPYFRFLGAAGTLLFLFCGPYNIWQGEKVRIDLAKKQITITYSDLRPFYPDSAEKGWKEILEFLDSNRKKIDSAGRPFLRQFDTIYFSEEAGKYSVTYVIKITCDTCRNAVWTPGWREFNQACTDFLFEAFPTGSEVVLVYKPLLETRLSKVSCAYPYHSTGQHLVMSLPDSVKTLEFEFSYDIASILQQINQERMEQKQPPLPAFGTADQYRKYYAAEKKKRKWK